MNQPQIIVKGGTSGTTIFMALGCFFIGLPLLVIGGCVILISGISFTGAYGELQQSMAQDKEIDRWISLELQARRRDNPELTRAEVIAELCEIEGVENESKLRPILRKEIERGEFKKRLPPPREPN